MDTLVTHGCGHQHSHALFRTFVADIDRQARQPARRRCTDCHKQASAEEAAVVAIRFGLPDLVGSDKQVAWAQGIRAKCIGALANGSRDIAVLGSRAEARWWIDNRQFNDADLLGPAERG